LLTDQFQRDTLGAWRNAARHIKVLREISLMLKEDTKAAELNNAIMKWRARATVTKQRRKAY
jgi:hypothetical protein